MKILKYGNPKLKQKCEPVEVINSYLRGQILDMFDLMKKSNGIGLAAPQVGINKRFFVVDLYDDKNKYTFINPVFTQVSKEYFKFEEGCLSFPGLSTTVQRHEWVEVTAQDMYGKQFVLKAEGLLAVVIQHETDHLDGTLLSDTTLEPEDEFNIKLKQQGLI